MFTFYDISRRRRGKGGEIEAARKEGRRALMDSAPRASATESERTAAANGNGRRGLIDLVRVAVEDTLRLVQQEIQLAKIEVQEMLRSNIKAAIFLGTAAFCGLVFFLML